MLSATGDGAGTVAIEGLVLPLAGAPAGPVRLAVRPERLVLAQAGAPGFAARITSRVFQGAHWLLSADSAAGALSIILHNDGRPAPGEGETVRLAFTPADVALLPETEAA